MEEVKVYMVVNLEIEDKETYLKYEKGFFPILKRHGGEFITFDDSFKHMEGPEPLSGGRMIIFSFSVRNHEVLKTRMRFHVRTLVFSLKWIFSTVLDWYTARGLPSAIT